MLKQKIQIAPSNMTRIVNCPLSNQYDEIKYYDPEIDYDKKVVLGNDDTSRGIVAHRYAAAVLSNNDEALMDAISTGLVTPKMEENLERYIDFIYQILPNADQEPILKVEKYLNLDFLYPGCYGRADTIIDSAESLQIVDLKYGFQEVDAERNFQLLAYAIGAENESQRQHDKIILYIFNAFTGTMNQWTLSNTEAADLTDWMKFRIGKAFERDEDYVFAGPWCENCNHCQECAVWYRRTIQGIEGKIDMTSKDWKRAAEWLTDEGKKKNINAMREATVQKIKAGAVQDKTVKTTTCYKWTKGALNKVVKHLQEQGFSESDYTELKVISPSQMRKKFAGDKEIEKIIKYNARKETRNKIVKK